MEVFLHETFGITLTSEGNIILEGKHSTEKYSDREINLSMKNACALHEMLGKIINIYKEIEKEHQDAQR